MLQKSSGSMQFKIEEQSEEQKTKAELANSKSDVQNGISPSTSTLVPMTSKKTHLRSPPSDNIGSRELPPGLDELSEEEARKIMSVMADAENQGILPSTSYISSVTTVPKTKEQTRQSSKRSIENIVPTGMEGLTEEERRHILEVMANVEQDARSSLSPCTSSSRSGGDSFMPPGMNNLSAEEQQKILSVMEAAEEHNASNSSHLPFLPSNFEVAVGGTDASLQKKKEKPSETLIPLPMENLSEEEREKIMAVVACAEMDEKTSIKNKQSWESEQHLPVTSVSPTIQQHLQISTPSIPSRMDDLLQEEKDKIMAVMACEAIDEQLMKQSKSPLVDTVDTESFVDAALPSAPNIYEPSTSIQSFEIQSAATTEDLKYEENDVFSESCNNGRNLELDIQGYTSEPSTSFITDMTSMRPRSCSEQFNIPFRSISPSRSSEEFYSKNDGISYIFFSLTSSRRKSMDTPQTSTYGGHWDELSSNQSKERQEQDKMLLLASQQSCNGGKLFQENIIPKQEVNEELGGIAAQMEDELPGVDLSHLSPAEKDQILAVMRMAQMDDPMSLGRKHREGTHSTAPTKVLKSVDTNATAPGTDVRSDHKSSRQTSIASSADLASPIRESGYGTTSTSYDRELGDYAVKSEHMSGLLEDMSEVREGARSRNDSRADERREDFDFTYSDLRFSEINDENFDEKRYKITSHDEKGINVDAVEVVEDQWKNQIDQWNKPRMWTTVFEGDESEQPGDDVFPHPPATTKHSTSDTRETGETYDSFQEDSTYRGLKEIAFDSTPKTFSSANFPSAATSKTINTSQWTPMGFPDTVTTSTSTLQNPEIKVTMHEEKNDSEDEESGSEEDDEYPDKVVAAPVAPIPSFDEVEREREQQEQFGKEVLQQIQAFGEAADDEFDSSLPPASTSSSQPFALPCMPTGTTITLLSEQKHDDPLDLSKEEGRKNPFLESSDDEDVSIDMEEVDYTQAAKFYQVQPLFCHRPGPVYTIPEDESEDDGTIENSESRMIAREKKRRTAHSVADSIISMYSTPTTSASSAVSALSSAIPTTTYAIISFEHEMRCESSENTRFATATVDSHIYTSHSHSQKTKPPITTASSIYTSSYLFSTTPFILPTTSPSIYTPITSTFIPSNIRSSDSNIPVSISASIDKTMADIESLLDSVYTSDGAKPNLLYYNQKSFTQAVGDSSSTRSSYDNLPLATSLASTTTNFLQSPLVSLTASSASDVISSPSPSFLLPLSATLGSTLGSLQPKLEDGGDISPRGLRRSPGMMIPTDVFGVPQVHTVFPTKPIDTTSTLSSTEPPNTFDELTSCYKWLKEITEYLLPMFCW
uniref:Protein kinase domain-containing protein n=1 Tax=Heterorhabditis bacteriophora TaxID=37862 RepID=A0A1I7WN09_HETBA